MKVNPFIILCLNLSVIVLSCNNNQNPYDATGIFECDEIIVSAEATGRILELKIEEGSVLAKDSVVGKIDPIQYELQADQITSSIKAVEAKTIPDLPQIRILESQKNAQEEQIRVIQLQLKNAKYEKERIEKLVKSNAAPGKQLDDVLSQVDILSQQLKLAESQIQVTQQQIKSQKEIISAQNKGIRSESEPLQKRMEMAQDYLRKSKITNPVAGSVLLLYMHEGEVATIGKPIYKIGNLEQMTLRAYLDGSQLSKVKLNQQVTLYVDFGENEVKNYSGTITWISDKAEFTPKTIQTKKERSNLVYAIKIRVPNDGFLKLGMYSEVKF